MPPALSRSPDFTDNKASTLRSLLHVINNDRDRNKHAAPKPAPRLQPPAPPVGSPDINLEELKRLLILAKQTIREEREKIARLRERMTKLHAFEDAFFRNRDTLEELRADRDLWRQQAVAMSNWLLGEPSLSIETTGANDGSCR
jgi:hypothetical protein